MKTGHLPVLEVLLKKHEALFKDELGVVSAHRATLHLKAGSVPKFSVPFYIRDAIGQQLNRLECDGVIKKVFLSSWAAPIVAVPKKDGHFRICGDYEVTINPSLEVDQYPLPNPTDLYASLTGGQKFTKLDLSQAYQQLLLDKASLELTTITTHQGLYQYTRLPFGVASAPAIF